MLVKPSYIDIPDPFMFLEDAGPVVFKDAGPFVNRSILNFDHQPIHSSRPIKFLANKYFRLYNFNPLKQ
jgi:hypothetical protein